MKKQPWVGPPEWEMAKVGRRGALAGDSVQRLWCFQLPCSEPLWARGAVWGAELLSHICCRRGAGRVCAGLERASGFPPVFSLDVLLRVWATAGESICYSDKLNACAQWLRAYATCVTPWTVAHQAPLSMGFFRQEYWSGLPRPPPGDLPDPEIEPISPLSPACRQGRHLNPRGCSHVGIWGWAQISPVLHSAFCKLCLFLLAVSLRGSPRESFCFTSKETKGQGLKLDLN